MGESFITCREDKGSINISEDVITGIVRSAVLEIESVAGLSNAAGAEIAEFVGLKSAYKGVKIRFDGQCVTVDAIITVIYGSNIMKVAGDVQDAVIAAVQSATGIADVCANIHVSGISFEK